MLIFTERLNFLITEHSAGKPTVFAKKAGIPPGTFDNYLKGRLPQAAQLIRIHETYNVNIDWLLTGKGHPYVIASVEAETYPTRCLDAEEYELVPVLQSWVKGGPEGRLLYEGIDDYFRSSGTSLRVASGQGRSVRRAFISPG